MNFKYLFFVLFIFNLRNCLGMDSQPSLSTTIIPPSFSSSSTTNILNSSNSSTSTNSSSVSSFSSLPSVSNFSSSSSLASSSTHNLNLEKDNKKFEDNNVVKNVKKDKERKEDVVELPSKKQKIEKQNDIQDVYNLGIVLFEKATEENDLTEKEKLLLEAEKYFLEAEMYFRKALKTDPDNANFNGRLGLVLCKQSNCLNNMLILACEIKYLGLNECQNRLSAINNKLNEANEYLTKATTALKEDPENKIFFVKLHYIRVILDLKRINSSSLSRTYIEDYIQRL